MSELSLLCVHPHPDDESIACGGVLARYADEGARVKVVICTGGEAGQNLAGIDLEGRSIAEARREEVGDALAVLGVDDHEFLGYRDSGMAGEATNDHPESFHQADLDEAAARLARIVRAFRPLVVVSDDEQGGYGHPDHVQANRVTTRALELAADGGALPDAGPAWRVAKRYYHTLPRSRVVRAHHELVSSGLSSPFGDEDTPPEEVGFGTPDEHVTTHVDILEWLDRKRAAMAAHRSQIAADSLFLNVPDELSAALFGTESFVLADPETTEPAVETDLFSGLR